MMMTEVSLEDGTQKQTVVNFITSNTTNFVDNVVPHQTVLEKCGRFGVCVANNRSGVVKLIAGLLLVSFVVIQVQTSMGLVRLAANGLTVAAPFSATWSDKETVDNMIMELISSNVVVNNRTVESVVEPMKHISMVKHISLLIIALHQNDTLHAVVESDVKNGYLQWKPFNSHLNANFTLAHAYRLLRNSEAVKKEEEVSICYVEYGLPHNIIYLPKSDLILYEPRVESKSSETIKVKSSCDFTTLVEKFFIANEKQISVSSYEVIEKGIVYPPKNESDDWSNIAKSGAVSYIDSHATRRQSVFGIPEFQGIEHCISLYQMLLKPLKNDIVF